MPAYDLAALLASGGHVRRRVCLRGADGDFAALSGTDGVAKVLLEGGCTIAKNASKNVTLFVVGLSQAKKGAHLMLAHPDATFAFEGGVPQFGSAGLVINAVLGGAKTDAAAAGPPAAPG